MIYPRGAEVASEHFDIDSNGLQSVPTIPGFPWKKNDGLAFDLPLLRPAWGGSIAR